MSDPILSLFSIYFSSNTPSSLLNHNSPHRKHPTILDASLRPIQRSPASENRNLLERSCSRWKSVPRITRGIRDQPAEAISASDDNLVPRYSDRAEDLRAYLRRIVGWSIDRDGVLTSSAWRTCQLAWVSSTTPLCSSSVHAFTTSRGHTRFFT